MLLLTTDPVARLANSVAQIAVNVSLVLVGIIELEVTAPVLISGNALQPDSMHTTTRDASTGKSGWRML